MESITMSAAQTTSSIWLFLSAIAFMFVGLIYHPLFFACSIFLYAAAEAKRNRIAGILARRSDFCSCFSSLATASARIWRFTRMASHRLPIQGALRPSDSVKPMPLRGTAWFEHLAFRSGLRRECASRHLQ
jgi:hypothetical protein